jgi:isoleucyl-tRNA synthetase
MHKSKGTAIWFDEAVEKMGADVMRWMFAKHNPTQNLNFGYSAGTEIKRTLLTLWNVYSFFVTYANIDKFNPVGKRIDSNTLTKLDLWILSRLNSLILHCDKYYENYDVASVVREVEKFFDELSNWYVRRSRRRFWKSENDLDKATAYLVLYECLVKLIKIMSPIMPFLTEEMYQNLVAQINKELPESVHLCDFPEVELNMINEKLEEEVALTRSIVSLGRAARNKVNIKIRQPLNEIIIRLPEAKRLTEEYQAIILEELNIKRIKSIGPNVTQEIIEYRLKPKFQHLGPKWGKMVNKVGEWIKTMTQDEIQTLISSNKVSKRLDGKVVEINSEDVEIEKVEQKGWSVVEEGDLGVGVNTSLSRELENEGLVRELVHKIQLMRKEADFDLVDRIKIFYQTTSKLKEAILENIEYLKNETLAIEVLEGAKDGDITRTLNINGIEAKISLQKIKRD